MSGFIAEFAFEATENTFGSGGIGNRSGGGVKAWLKASSGVESDWLESWNRTVATVDDILAAQERKTRKRIGKAGPSNGEFVK